MDFKEKLLNREYDEISHDSFRKYNENSEDNYPKIDVFHEANFLSKLFFFWAKNTFKVICCIKQIS